MNNVSLVGRLTRDVDLRYTSNGKAVANFNLAVNRPFKNANGEQEADFINGQVWGKPAENLANYMKKGNQIGLTGRINTRNYENNEGKRVYVTEVVADNVQFLESKKETNSDNRNNYSRQKPSQAHIDAANKEVKQQSDPFANNGEPIDISDEDLPF
jgi:single-strand DNA-binding protein